MYKIGKVALSLLLVTSLSACLNAPKTTEVAIKEERPTKVNGRSMPRDKFQRFYKAEADCPPNDHEKKFVQVSDLNKIELKDQQNLIKEINIAEKDDTDHKKLHNTNFDLGFAPMQSSTQIGVMSREDFMSARSNGNTNLKVNNIRASMLRETALSIGARGGLAEKARSINATLNNYDRALSRVFNFYGLLLEDNVLPPVLVEGRNTLNIANDDVIRIADRNYKIIKQAKFVTAPPTWRDYIWMNFSYPELPDPSLLPKNKAEKIVWEYELNKGWEAGIAQADMIFQENINRLKRDINGMILYRHLLTKNMVSPPYVAALEMGVTGDNNDMSIGDKVLRITAFPALQTDSSQWKTQIRLRDE